MSLKSYLYDQNSFAPFPNEIEIGDFFEETPVDLEIEHLAMIGEAQPRRSMTTDLVRLYLQDIGRVPLLKKDEEVQKAQQVQRHLYLVEQRSFVESASNPVLHKYNHLIEVHDQLSSQLGHRPSWERWASTVGLTSFELKAAVSEGKKCWAQLAELEISELDEIITLGLRAKEQMIKANLRLVVSVAKKYQNRGLELLDLIQEGTLGLERAVEKFDPTKGYRFSTYAYWWIRQGITRAIATQSRIIRLPVHITEKLNKIKKAQRKISQTKGRTATMEEVAKELEMTPPQVREILMRVPRSVSLEVKVGKEKDTELVDLLETEEISPEETLIQESLQKDLKNLLSDLTTREQEVIQLRYGFKDGKSYSLADIGRVLELSRERVRQIETKALQKLRQPRRRNLVKDYFEALC
jgi:RNA polymerase nonessential primary-like sigma factor